MIASPIQWPDSCPLYNRYLWGIVSSGCQWFFSARSVCYINIHSINFSVVNGKSTGDTKTFTVLSQWWLSGNSCCQNVRSKSLIESEFMKLFHKSEYIAQFQMTDFSLFCLVWFGSVWSRFYQLFGLLTLLLRPFIRNWRLERRTETDYSRISFIMYC